MLTKEEAKEGYEEKEEFYKFIEFGSAVYIVAANKDRHKDTILKTDIISVQQ